MLRTWSKVNVGDVTVRVTASKLALDNIQDEISSQCISYERILQEREAQASYLSDLALQAP